MQGDAFEMEDHRNWNDASYKTYIRPLAKPWPYTLEAGETTEQSVTLAVEGRCPQVAAGARGAGPARARRPRRHACPQIGLSLRPEHADADPRGRRPDQAARAAVPGLPVRFADRRGLRRPGRRSAPRPSRSTGRVAERGKVHGRLYRAMGEATGAELVLEAVIACRDEAGSPSADPAIMRRDLARGPRRGGGRRRALRQGRGVAGLRSQVHAARQHLAALPAGRRDLRRGARGLPRGAIGGGMFSYFTELNRKRPPAEAARLRGPHQLPDRARLRRHHGDGEPRGAAARHPLDAQLHRRQALPGRARARSARATIPTAPRRRPTPRAAASRSPSWTRASAASWAPPGTSATSPTWRAARSTRSAWPRRSASSASPTPGPDYPQPWFDEHGAKVYPALPRAARPRGGGRQPRLATTLSDGAAVQAVAQQADGGLVLWLANLTGAPQTVTLEGLAGARGRIARLDESSFVADRRRGGRGGGRGRPPRSMLARDHAALRVRAHEDRTGARFCARRIAATCPAQTRACSARAGIAVVTKCREESFAGSWATVH